MVFVVVPPLTRFDHLVAIERSGRAQDGNYYNMRGQNVKHLVDPIDDLFLTAQNIPGVMTTGESGSVPAGTGSPTPWSRPGFSE